MSKNDFLIWLFKKMHASRWRYENAANDDEEKIELGSFTAYQNVYLYLKGKDIDI